MRKMFPGNGQIEPYRPWSDGRRAADSIRRRGYVRRVWTEADNQMLLALRAEGLTRRQIAKQMGVTHNAVIGKLYRLEPAKVMVQSAPQIQEPSLPQNSHLESIRKTQERAWFRVGYSREEVITMFDGWPTALGYAPYEWTVGYPDEVRQLAPQNA